jgi:hypothetical protein
MVADEEAQNAGSKARIFISYSRKDMAFADKLEAALKARDFAPLIDRTEIYAFEDWWKRIEILISRADTVVFVLSPDAVTSDVALKEVAYAASLNKRLGAQCDQVPCSALQFASILNQNAPVFGLRDFSKQRIHQRCLTGRGAAP